METQERFSVLVVDDDELVRVCLVEQLKRRFEVTAAASGAEGLELLQARSFHVVLSDQIMPNMSGDQFLAEVRRLYPRSFRMLISGYADLADVIRAINLAGVGYYLRKPWEVHELLNAVRRGAEWSASQPLEGTVVG